MLTGSYVKGRNNVQTCFILKVYLESDEYGLRRTIGIDPPRTKDGPLIGGWKEIRVVLSDIDRRLLERCLAQVPNSWQEFVDRFLGLVLHVVNHTADSRSVELASQDREDLAADVFCQLIDDDFAVLRRFRGDSSLATYLTVIARRVVVRELKKRSPALRKIQRSDHLEPESYGSAPDQRLSDHDEVERLISQLNDPEAEIVRMYHLEGKSYQEISAQLGMPENSIGPTLSRARSKMRNHVTG